MKPEFDVGGPNDTLWAVFLGALLATLGGFLATQIENWFSRREKHRAAAMMFTDVLQALGYLTKLAGEARGRGEPYGPITMRMLRAARREIDLYDRNRECLYDLHDPALRVAIHVLIVRMTMPLDGVIDSVGELALLQDRANALKTGTVARREADRRLKELGEMRDLGFEFVMDVGLETKPLVDRLAHIGGTMSHRFDRN